MPPRPPRARAPRCSTSWTRPPGGSVRWRSRCTTAVSTTSTADCGWTRNRPTRTASSPRELTRGEAARIRRAGPGRFDVYGYVTGDRLTRILYTGYGLSRTGTGEAHDAEQTDVDPRRRGTSARRGA